MGAGDISQPHSVQLFDTSGCFDNQTDAGASSSSSGSGGGNDTDAGSSAGGGKTW